MFCITIERDSEAVEGLDGDTSEIIYKRLRKSIASVTDGESGPIQKLDQQNRLDSRWF